MSSSGQESKQANTAAATSFQGQTFADYLSRKFPPKEPLIEGVLFKRDRISLTGRRRHGKTTVLGNIALAGADLDAREYLGFRISRPFTTIAFFLEDDSAELQLKLARMADGRRIDPSRFHLYTNQDLRERRIPKNSKNVVFRQFVHDACRVAKPDLIILDNLGMLIAGAYMDAEEIHALMELAVELADTYDCAVLISAHPRKAGENIISLRENPELFFEQTMGSSHFINSTGSLWGIEREADKERTTLLLASQRFTGTHQFTLVEKGDDDWFERIDDITIAYQTVVNTDIRVKAFGALPESGTFTYADAQTRVRAVGVMKSNGSFNPWWKELLRLGLVAEVEKGKYKKAKISTTQQQGSNASPSNVAKGKQSVQDFERYRKDAARIMEWIRSDSGFAPGQEFTEAQVAAAFPDLGIATVQKTLPKMVKWEPNGLQMNLGGKYRRKMYVEPYEEFFEPAPGADLGKQPTSST